MVGFLTNHKGAQGSLCSPKMPAKLAVKKTGFSSSSFDYYDWDNFKDAAALAPFGYRCKVPLWIPLDTTIEDQDHARNMRVRVYVFQYLALPFGIRRERTLNEFIILEVGSSGEDFALLRKILPDGTHFNLLQDLDLDEWKYTNSKKVSFEGLVPLVELPSAASHLHSASPTMGDMFGYQVYLPPAFRIPRSFMGDTGSYEAGIRNYVRNQVLVAANGEPEGLDAFLLLWDSERNGFVTVVRKRSKGGGGIALVCREMNSSSEAGIFYNKETGHALSLMSVQLPEMAGQEFEWLSEKTTTYGFRVDLPDVFKQGMPLSYLGSDFIHEEVFRSLRKDALHFDVIPFAEYQIWITGQPTTNGYQLLEVDHDAQVALFTPCVPEHEKTLLVQFACMAELQPFCSDQFGYRLEVAPADALVDLKGCVKRMLRGMGIKADICTYGEDGGEFTVVPMGHPEDYYAILRIYDKRNDHNQLLSIDHMHANHAIYRDVTNGKETTVTFDQLLNLTTERKRARPRYIIPNRHASAQ